MLVSFSHVLLCSPMYSEMPVLLRTLFGEIVICLLRIVISCNKALGVLCNPLYIDLSLKSVMSSVGRANRGYPFRFYHEGG